MTTPPPTGMPRKPIRKRWAFLALGGFVLLLVAAIYVAAFWHQPKPTVDYLPMLNANALAVAEEDRAWPLYRELILKYDVKNMHRLPGWGPKRNPHYLPPGQTPATSPAGASSANSTLDELWGNTVSVDTTSEFLTEEGPIPSTDTRWPGVLEELPKYDGLFESLRQAGRKKGMGFVFQHTYTGDDARVITPLVKNRGSLWEGALLTSPLPFMSESRKFCHMLSVDITRALDQQDHARAIANLQAMAGLARHVSEFNTFLHVLVASNLFDIIDMDISRLLATRGRALSDADLQTLCDLLDQMDRIPPYDWRCEEWNTRDMMQRIYGPHGRVTYMGAKHFVAEIDTSLSRTFGRSPVVLALGMPWVALTTATEKQIIAEYETLTARARSERSLSLAQLRARPISFQDWSDEFNRSEAKRNQYWPLAMHFLGMWDAYLTGRQLTFMQHEGLRVAIALERFNQATGHYPSSLDELVPSHLSKLPLDPVTTDKPFLYKLVDGKPLLYSRGLDGDDDDARKPIKMGSVTAIDGDWILHPLE